MTIFNTKKLEKIPWNLSLEWFLLHESICTSELLPFSLQKSSLQYLFVLKVTFGRNAPEETDKVTLEPSLKVREIYSSHSAAVCLSVCLYGDVFKVPSKWWEVTEISATHHNYVCGGRAVVVDDGDVNNPTAVSQLSPSRAVIQIIMDMMRIIRCFCERVDIQ